jgi:hypothetical protein
MSAPWMQFAAFGAMGLIFVCWSRGIARFYCRFFGQALQFHDGGIVAKGIERTLWLVTRVSRGKVHDEVSAPKAIRFMGWLLLLQTLTFALSYFQSPIGLVILMVFAQLWIYSWLIIGIFRP